MGVSKPYHSDEDKEKYDKEYERIFGEKPIKTVKKPKVKPKKKK
jgi:hypothetical protein